MAQQLAKLFFDLSQVGTGAADKTFEANRILVIEKLQEEVMDSSEKTNKSQTIANIDVNVKWPDFSEMKWNEEALYDHLHCCLCGSELKFKHATNHMHNVVTEEAVCPHCKIKTRESSHHLQ